MRLYRLYTSYILLAAATHHVAVTTSGPSPETAVPEIPGSRGAVASEAVECSAIGRNLLARGGNAVDALVGTTFCVGVVGMYHSGIGGGGFAVIRDKTGQYEAFEFRETAPANASEDMYHGSIDDSKYGGLAVAVPGEVRGLWDIHRKHGALEWKIVMQGAIHVARDGFIVSTDLENYMKKAVGNGTYNFLEQDPNWAQDFVQHGKLVKAGDIMTRKRYAKALEQIANRRVEGFYTGEVAESIVGVIQSTKGIMTADDLVNYRAHSYPAKSVSYHGLELSTIGAPASGTICLSVLKTMEQFHLTKPADKLTTHRFVEAMRFGYGARVQLGDPDYVLNVTEIEKELLSEDYAKRIRQHISDDHTLRPQDYFPKRIHIPTSHGTSHIVTADKSGMTTSLTTTINLLFGSHVMDPKFGIILNNEMNDFDIPTSKNFAPSSSHPNSIQAGKRPLSAITPVIVAYPNGTLYGAVGAAGSARIISATTQALWHAIEDGMTMQDALREPRWHDDPRNNTLYLEQTFDKSTAQFLAAKKHIIKEDEALTAVQALKRRGDGVFEAASEPRQNNSAGLTF